MFYLGIYFQDRPNYVRTIYYSSNRSSGGSYGHGNSRSSDGVPFGGRNSVLVGGSTAYVKPFKPFIFK